MADQSVSQSQVEIQAEKSPIKVWVATLWSQLEPARQKQLAQILAELIRRIRENPCQGVSNDEE